MKTVLFACVHNAGRSQIAAALFNQLADLGKARAISAGTHPGTNVHPEVVAVLREIGVDVATAVPRKLTDGLAAEVDLLVTMGCGEACPVVPGVERDDWPLDDPKGQPIERVREIRDDIGQRVRRLLAGRGWLNNLLQRRAAFRQLHDSGCFVIPNPWDIGSARYLRHLGFKALATTSSGFAFSRGEPDADWGVPRDAMLGHISEIVSATDLPVNADFVTGYGRDPDVVAENVRMCIATGVAGLSIEDGTGGREGPLHDVSLAASRIEAARAAIDKAGGGVLLTARAESYVVGHPNPLEDALARLTAYAERGADVLFAPGVREREDIRAIVEAVAPKPVNVVFGVNAGLTVSDLAELGVRRVSLGSGLARAAWTGFIRAAKLIADSGSFAGFEGSVTFSELDALFRRRGETS